MRTTIRDVQTLSKIQPLEIVSYLRSKLWQQVATIDHGWYWSKEQGDDSFEVLIPKDSNVRDLPYRRPKH